MRETIATQAKALEQSRDEFRKMEREFDRLSILYEICRDREPWQKSHSSERKPE